MKSEKWEKNIFYLILDVRSPALHSLVAARSPSFSSSFSCSSNIVNLKGQWIIIIFLIILTLGLIYEWIKGGLEWE